MHVSYLGALMQVAHDELTPHQKPLLERGGPECGHQREGATRSMPPCCCVFRKALVFNLLVSVVGHHRRYAPTHVRARILPPPLPSGSHISYQLEGLFSRLTD